MRFERVSGHPVVRRHLSLLKRDVNALKSVARERGVMAECLTAGCQIGSLSIDQLQAAEHRLRVLGTQVDMVQPNQLGVLGNLDAGAPGIGGLEAAGAGLDPDQARDVLNDKKRYADAVRADENQARELGISGVPFYVLDMKYGVSGAQPTEVFMEALAKAHADA